MTTITIAITIITTIVPSLLQPKFTRFMTVNFKATSNNHHKPASLEQL
jgi:hypothetical protein